MSWFPNAVLLVLALLSWPAAAGKVGVVLSTLSNSQLVFGFRLADELARKHEVVLIRPAINPAANKLQPPSGMKQIHVSALNDSALINAFLDVEKDLLATEMTSIFDRRWYRLMKTYGRLYQVACDLMVKNQKYLDELTAEKFDLIIGNHYEPCSLAIAHRVGVPKTAMAVSLPSMDTLLSTSGIFVPPSFVPGFATNSTNQMTYFERVKNLASSALGGVVTRFVYGPYDIITHQHFGDDFPEIRTLVRKMKLIFINNFDVIEYPRPTSAKVIYLGGIGINTSEVVTGKFDTFVNDKAKAKRPLVLFSLGTVADPSMLPPTWISVFLKFFRQNQHVDFVFKFKAANLDPPANVLVSEWIPQTALLAHNRTVAFISHCGFNSLQETIVTGTPVLCIPLFGDQPRNAKLAEFRGFGKVLTKSLISETRLTILLHDLVNNEKYAKAAAEVKSLIADRPFTSTELLNRWVSYAIKHDFDFTPPDLSTVVYFNLDIIVPVIVLVSVIGYYLLRGIFRLYYWSCCTMAYKEKVKFQ